MIPLLEQARKLDDDCRRLGLEAIERPQGRPDFHALFRDCHTFARGVGSADRVTILASSLSSLAGFELPTAQTETQLPVGASNGEGGSAGRAPVHSRLIQEEAVWQGAAGAFVSRFRHEYREAYVDVVTGICEAVEVTRVGLRLLAAAAVDAVDVDKNATVGKEGVVTVPPLARLQGLLLCFPYSCSEGLTAVEGEADSVDGLCHALQVALSPDVLGALGNMEGKDGPVVATGPQHVAVLQVRPRVCSGFGFIACSDRHINLCASLFFQYVQREGAYQVSFLFSRIPFIRNIIWVKLYSSFIFFPVRYSLVFFASLGI